jgi:hypothetical protein
MPAPLEVEAVDERSLVQRVLHLLQRRTGFDLVMATRVCDDDWRVVAATPSVYAVEAGDVFRWSDSICSRMVGTDRPGPWSVADVAADHVACSAPIRSRVPIGAYLGAPLIGADGAVIGTLCAIDPAIQPADLDGSELTLSAELVSWALERARGEASGQRRAERALVRDGAGVPVLDRQQWDRLLDAELDRTRWSGEALTVVLGRSVRASTSRGALTATADRLAGQLGPHDAVAVLGSNRLGVVVVGPPPDLDDARFAAETDGRRMQWVAAPIMGAGTAASVAAELEIELVGAGPATARAASHLLKYEFCAACGRKGVHRLTGTTAGRRCKYCQLVELDADADADGSVVAVAT